MESKGIKTAKPYVMGPSMRVVKLQQKKPAAEQWARGAWRATSYSRQDKGF
jgi:hypothetical protein